MKFWITVLLSDLPTPIIISIIGILYTRKPAQQINWLHGYRTERSMKNQETWEFAQHYFGKVCRYCGIGFTLITFLLLFSAWGQPQDVVTTLGNILAAADCFIMLGLFFPTERALKKKYHV